MKNMILVLRKRLKKERVREEKGLKQKKQLLTKIEVH